MVYNHRFYDLTKNDKDYLILMGHDDGFDSHIKSYLHLDIEKIQKQHGKYMFIPEANISGCITILLVVQMLLLDGMVIRVLDLLELRILALINIDNKYII